MRLASWTDTWQFWRGCAGVLRAQPIVPRLDTWSHAGPNSITGRDSDSGKRSAAMLEDSVVHEVGRDDLIGNGVPQVRAREETPWPGPAETCGLPRSWTRLDK